MRLGRTCAAGGIAAIVLLLIVSFNWQMDRQIKVDAIHGKKDKTDTLELSSSQPCEDGLVLYPEENPGSDRIIEQLEFRPCGNMTDTLTILLWGGVASWGGIGPKNGDEVFHREECWVRHCTLTSNRKDISSADLVIFRVG